MFCRYCSNWSFLEELESRELSISQNFMDNSKYNDNSAALENGRKLFAQNCKFTAGSTLPENLPLETLPEVAFAGRSNSGKSTLINKLTNSTKLARVSKTPGRTKQINFFNLGDRLMLVDLPGYGYAKVAKMEAAAWLELFRHYISKRRVLKLVCLLIDGRHGIKDSDHDIMTVMDKTATNFQVIFTKADETEKEAMKRNIEAGEAALMKHPAAYPKIHVVSSHTGDGIPELRARLSEMAIQ